MTMEILRLAGGLWLYTRTTQPNGKAWCRSLLILVAFLGLGYLGNAWPAAAELAGTRLGGHGRMALAALGALG